MAESPCRSCGEPVPTGAGTCPHCGVPDPVVATSPTPPAATSAPLDADQVGATAPASEHGAEPVRPAGTRLSGALKALGCLVIALLVFGIALVVGVFDIFF